ncbi:hypothetical protein KIM372_15880 [Bombiscardovia nodaiensis]|uniref:Uncharacterized protein n=1 Tax=Bombiscardovia nodaiensis TaxID=2932181 RepID=A0ABM8BAR2_9BIFI|nr:hypothetical protein KIM372_15880 [Bombiscardovia nodaiensis]
MASAAEFVRVFRQSHPEHRCEFGPVVRSGGNPDNMMRIREHNAHLFCTPVQIRGSRPYSAAEFMGEDDEQELADHLAQLLTDMDQEFDFDFGLSRTNGLLARTRTITSDDRASACTAWSDLLGYANFTDIEDLLGQEILLRPIVGTLTDELECIAFLFSIFIDLMHPGYLTGLYAEQDSHEFILNQYRKIVVAMLYDREIPDHRVALARKLLYAIVRRLPTRYASSLLRQRLTDELLLLDWWMGDVDQAREKASKRMVLGFAEQSRDGMPGTISEMGLWVVSSQSPGWLAEDDGNPLWVRA